MSTIAAALGLPPAARSAGYDASNRAEEAVEVSSSGFFDQAAAAGERVYDDATGALADGREFLQDLGNKVVPDGDDIVKTVAIVGGVAFIVVALGGLLILRVL